MVILWTTEEEQHARTHARTHVRASCIERKPTESINHPSASAMHLYSDSTGAKRENEIHINRKCPAKANDGTTPACTARLAAHSFMNASASAMMHHLRTSTTLHVLIALASPRSPSLPTTSSSCPPRCFQIISSPPSPPRFLPVCMPHDRHCCLLPLMWPVTFALPPAENVVLPPSFPFPQLLERDMSLMKTRDGTGLGRGVAWLSVEWRLSDRGVLVERGQRGAGRPCHRS